MRDCCARRPWTLPRYSVLRVYLLGPARNDDGGLSLLLQVLYMLHRSKTPAVYFKTISFLDDLCTAPHAFSSARPRLVRNTYLLPPALPVLCKFPTSSQSLLLLSASPGWPPRSTMAS